MSEETLVKLKAEIYDLMVKRQQIDDQIVRTNQQIAETQKQIDSQSN